MQPNDEIMKYYGNQEELDRDPKDFVKEFLVSLEQEGLTSQINNTTFLNKLIRQYKPDSPYRALITETYDSYEEEGRTYNSRLIVIRCNDGTDILFPGIFLDDNERIQKENLGLCMIIDENFKKSSFKIDQFGNLIPVEAVKGVLQEIHKAQETLIKDDDDPLC